MAHNSTPALTRYTAAARTSSARLITEYSTSFSLATRVLPGAVREDIAVIYALVRLADEIVDGVAIEAGLSDRQVEAALDALENDTEQALSAGYSTNLVVHAFAATARTAGIGAALTRPFFASMRADIAPRHHDEESLAAYIYGSAEVVGLMCLRVFARMPGTDTARMAELTRAARSLGAAFQKVNFLRDLAVDDGALGRHYLPEAGRFTDADKDAFVATIRADLAAADAGMAYLDVRARIAVRIARRLFGELTDALDATPAAEVARRRVRVSNARKAAIAATVIAGAATSRGRA